MGWGWQKKDSVVRNRALTLPFALCCCFDVVGQQPGRRAKEGPENLRLGGRRESGKLPEAEVVKPHRTWHRRTTQAGLRPSVSWRSTLAFLVFLEHTRPDLISSALCWPFSREARTHFLTSSKLSPTSILSVSDPLCIAGTTPNTHRHTPQNL